MTSPTEIAVAIVAAQTSFNALSAIECMNKGLNTPLIAHFGLTEHVETLRAADSATVAAELAEQYKAVNAVRKAINAGTTTLDGVEMPEFHIPEATIEAIRAYRRAS